MKSLPPTAEPFCCTVALICVVVFLSHFSFGLHLRSSELWCRPADHLPIKHEVGNVSYGISCDFLLIKLAPLSKVLLSAPTSAILVLILITKRGRCPQTSCKADLRKQLT